MILARQAAPTQLFLGLMLGPLISRTAFSASSVSSGADRFGNLADASGNPRSGPLTDQSVNTNNQIVGTVYL